MAGRMRWADALDDEDVLPDNTTVGPNEKGVIIKTEYYNNAKGEAMKRTTKVQLVKVQTKVYEVTAERKKWAKFGFAAKTNEGVTMQSQDEIMFEQTNKPKKADDKKQDPALAAEKAMAGSRSLAEVLAEKRKQRELMRVKGLLPEAERPPADDDARPAPGAAPGAPGGAPRKEGAYVPPSRKAGGGASAAGMGMGMPDRRDQDHSLRVSNLSENVNEQDLKELFGRFGDISRVYVAYNRETNEHRGFAFVNFRHAFDAERAKQMLNGFGFDNMILQVEAAAPREPR